MIIKFIQPHALNFGEDFEYVFTFLKGKKKSYNVEDLRLICKGTKTNDEYIFYLEKRENFFGKDRYSIGYMPLDECKKINNNHYKNRNYNYYRSRFDITDVEDVLSEFIKSDPMLPLGVGVHQFKSVIKNYKGTYLFNNKLY